MNGTSSSRVNHSATASRNIDGANGQRFAALNFQIENVFHIGAARIAEDRAVAECARSPFHAPLEPADDEAVGNGTGRRIDELFLVLDVIDAATLGFDRRAPIVEQRAYFTFGE